MGSPVFPTVVYYFCLCTPHSWQEGVPSSSSLVTSHASALCLPANLQSPRFLDQHQVWQHPWQRGCSRARTLYGEATGVQISHPVCGRLLGALESQSKAHLRSHRGLKAGHSLCCFLCKTSLRSLLSRLNQAVRVRSLERLKLLHFRATRRWSKPHGKRTKMWWGIGTRSIRG